MKPYPTTILREAIVRAYDGPGGPFAESTAEAVLATRIPQACQTCKGSGTIVRDGAMGYLVDADCPDCPTILTLLLWGVNVSTAEEHRGQEHRGQYRHTNYDEGWNDCLAALREVPT